MAMIAVNLSLILGPKIDKVEKNQHMKASGMKRYDSWILDSLCAHHSDHKG